MAEWIVLGIMMGFSLYDIKCKKVKTAAVVCFGMVVLVYRLCIGTGAAELLLGLFPGIILLGVSFVTRESIGKDKPMNRTTVNKIFNKHSDKMTPHQERHGWATNGLETGIYTINEVQYLARTQFVSKYTNIFKP